MVIGALPQVQPSPSPRSQPELPASAGKTGNSLPPGNPEDAVTISEGGRSALERELRSMAEARDNQELVDLRGHEGKIRLGLMALGQSTVDDWLSKGLEMDESTIIAAGEAFQEAFRKNLEENGTATAGSAIALNRHQIVINSQPVPDWFVREYENTLSLLGEGPLRNAFEQGETSYLVPPSPSRSNALNRYAEVKHSF